jgi:hypothetical protein
MQNPLTNAGKGIKENDCKSETGFLVLRHAIPAIDRPSFSGFKWNFALFTPVGADRLCHIPVTETFRATKTFSFHWITLAVVICKQSITGPVDINLHYDSVFFYNNIRIRIRE